jgi:hypothetical protein
MGTDFWKMKTPGQSPDRIIIIFSTINMDFHPTSFFILENIELGTFWVGQTKMKLGINGQSFLPCITRNQLVDKLVAKYVNYDFPCLDIVSINKNGFVPFYGLERWLSKLDYKIKESPKKYEELDKLLKAGWHRNDTISHSKINVLQAQNPTDLNKLYKRLISDWEAKGMRCLNTLKCKTDKEKYEDKKQDPNFMYKRARNEVLRQMKKTGKMPKQSTIKKYQIKEDEIKECMGRKGIIYKITSPSGKVYVGQTIQNFNERIKSHNRKDSGCTAISRAIQKYKNQMKYEIIENNVPQEQLDEREIFWIKEINSLTPNGYNLNTGGQFFQITQEAKDRLRDTQNRLAIEKNGYLGTVHQNGNTFTPVINNNTMYTFLSKGGFATKEEAVEVLKEYTKDPENFEKVEGTIQRTIGSVYKNSPNKWAASYKKERLGHYYTKKEAEEALERYLKDPKNFVKPEKIRGGVYKKSNNTWQAKYKNKYLGTYQTEEEGRKALERYLKDPQKFTKDCRKVGCVYKKYNKWVVVCKSNRLGSYDTQEEAENVLSMYIAQSSIYTSSSESS